MTDLPATTADGTVLEDLLPRPGPALVAEFAGVDADILLLDAAARTGPVPCRLLRRTDPSHRVIAAVRWSGEWPRTRMEARRIDALAAHPTDRTALAAPPDAPNLISPRKCSSPGRAAAFGLRGGGF